MRRSENTFMLLAARTEGGDSSAPSELRRQLEPELIRIVRRVIQGGAGPSSVDRRILVEARRVGLDAERARTPDGEQLIRAVAHTVSALFVNGLRAKQHNHFAHQETVCN